MKLGWGDGSHGKMLATQEWGFEFDPQNPCQNKKQTKKKALDMVACSCNARAGEVEAGGPLAFDKLPYQVPGQRETPP